MTPHGFVVTEVDRPRWKVTTRCACGWTNIATGDRMQPTKDRATQAMLTHIDEEHAKEQDSKTPA